METYDPAKIQQDILAAAIDVFTVDCIEGGIAFPPEILRSLLPPIMRTAIETTARHYARHPEQLAFAGIPCCLVCGSDVETWTTGRRDEPSLFDARAGDLDPAPVFSASPCGHQQPWPGDEER